MTKSVVLLVICVGFAHAGTPSGLYEDDGSGHTILAQKFSRKDVREMSFDLLSIMGFHRKPHPHFRDSQSPASIFLSEVYESLALGEEIPLTDMRRKTRGQPINLTWSEFNIANEEVEAIAKSDAIVSFQNRGHRYSSELPAYEEEKQFWFDVSEVIGSEGVLGAELRVWKKSMGKPIEGETDALRISVNIISKQKDSTIFELNELDEVVAAKWEEGWLRLNVTEAFRHWIQTQNSNFGLLLSTKRADNGEEIPMVSSGLASILDTEEHQPFLVSFLIGSGQRGIPRKEPIKRRRVLRGVDEGQKRAKKTKKGREFSFEDLGRPRSCQMGMLYVNFEDLGWKDWVIAPDGFIAYYCTGECSFPLTAAMNATNHAIVSTLVHTYYPKEYPKPSCAPLKLGSISMLYYDDNSNVTVKKYKDMVIKSCGCK